MSLHFLYFDLQVNYILPALGFFLLNVFIPGPNVLNTIATSMGSGRKSGIACAIATGLGVIFTSLISLLGATAIFYKFEIIYKSLTVIGVVLLIYFANRYIKKSLFPNEVLVALNNVDPKIAFRQAFLVLISNPKMLTTFLAVISLFPIVASDFKYAFTFSLIAGGLSFIGHLIFATVFSTRIASKLYMKLYRSINALVGIGFVIYAIKLFLSIY